MWKGQGLPCPSRYRNRSRTPQHLSAFMIRHDGSAANGSASLQVSALMPCYIPDHPPRRWPVGPIRIAVRSRREADACWQMLRGQSLITSAVVSIENAVAFEASLADGRWHLEMPAGSVAPGG